jgi:hypothetical protein
LSFKVRYVVREYFGQAPHFSHRDFIQPNADEARALLSWLAPFTLGAVAYAVKIDETGASIGEPEVMDIAGEVPPLVA